jgi:Poly(R)-hydroxyalkanoic acid synthase subunit (PHA_synth_III_E)
MAGAGGSGAGFVGVGGEAAGRAATDRLQAIGAAYATLLAELGRLLGGTAGGDSAPDAEAFAAACRDFSATLGAWPGASPSGLAPGMADGSAAGAAWSQVLADIARATADTFAARLAGPERPETLRATLDAWIDCAEAAFAAAAHSEPFCRAQAAWLNESVRLRAQQQCAIEQSARALGLPTRSEVDALHDALRRVEDELAAARAAPPKATRSPRR